jgi:hypothetical protein
MGGGGMYYSGGISYAPPYMILLIGLLFITFIFIIYKMSDSKFRLHDLINIGGVIIGIALTAIGSIFLLNAVLKLYVFDFDSNPYFSATEQCRYDHNNVKMGESPTKLEGEAFDTCVTEKTEQENLRYVRKKQESMIDGLAMLLVGIPFWLIFGVRRKKKK